MAPPLSGVVVKPRRRPHGSEGASGSQRYQRNGSASPPPEMPLGDGEAGDDAAQDTAYGPETADRRLSMISVSKGKGKAKAVGFAGFNDEMELDERQESEQQVTEPQPQSHDYTDDLDDIDRCAICLSEVQDKTIISPCEHSSYCFACILAWSDQSRRCPLCLGPISHLLHNIRSDHDYQRYFPLPLPLPVSSADRDREQRHAAALRILTEDDLRRTLPPNRSHRRRTRPRKVSDEDEEEAALERRRYVYRHGLFAKHIASNAYTRFRNVPPTLFATSLELRKKVTTFLRRELRVFPSVDIEFLVMYVISIMGQLELKSDGAIRLIGEFLGGEDGAEHFAHELSTFLRSPYTDLRTFDAIVQYGRPQLPRSPDPSPSPPIPSATHDRYPYPDRRRPRSPSLGGFDDWHENGRYPKPRYRDRDVSPPRYGRDPSPRPRSPSRSCRELRSRPRGNGRRLERAAYVRPAARSEILPDDRRRGDSCEKSRSPPTIYEAGSRRLSPSSASVSHTIDPDAPIDALAADTSSMNGDADVNQSTLGLPGTLPSFSPALEASMVLSGTIGPTSDEESDIISLGPSSRSPTPPIVSHRAVTPPVLSKPASRPQRSLRDRMDLFLAAAASDAQDAVLKGPRPSDFRLLQGVTDGPQGKVIKSLSIKGAASQRSAQTPLAVEDIDIQPVVNDGRDTANVSAEISPSPQFTVANSPAIVPSQTSAVRQDEPSLASRLQSRLAVEKAAYQRPRANAPPVTTSEDAPASKAHTFSQELRARLMAKLEEERENAAKQRRASTSKEGPGLNLAAKSEGTLRQQVLQALSIRRAKHKQSKDRESELRLKVRLVRRRRTISEPEAMQAQPAPSLSRLNPSAPAFVKSASESDLKAALLQRRAQTATEPFSEGLAGITAQTCSHSTSGVDAATRQAELKKRLASLRPSPQSTIPASGGMPSKAPTSIAERLEKERLRVRLREQSKKLEALKKQVTQAQTVAR